MFGLLAVLLVTLVSIGGGASPAVATFGWYDCHSRSIRVVFYGADAASAPSKIDVYVGTGKRYSAADRVATVTVEGTDIAARCTTDTSAPVRIHGQMREKRRGGKPVAVQCSATRNLMLQFGDYGTARGVFAFTTLRHVIYAIVGVRPSLPNEYGQPIYQFDASVCRKVAGPH
jgi:hypothetical protein